MMTMIINLKIQINIIQVMWVCMPTSELNNRNCFQQFQAYLKMYSTSLLFWDIFSLVPCFKVLIVFCIKKNFNVGSQKCLKEHPITLTLSVIIHSGVKALNILIKVHVFVYIETDVISLSCSNSEGEDKSNLCVRSYPLGRGGSCGRCSAAVSGVPCSIRSTYHWFLGCHRNRNLWHKAWALDSGLSLEPLLKERGRQSENAS